MRVTQEELDNIVCKYKDMVWRVALSVSHNEQDARDIFQDVFLRLITSIDRIRNEEHLKNWLIRVTVNRGYSLSKSSWKRKVDSYERLRDETGDAIEPRMEDDYSYDEQDALSPGNAQTERGELVLQALSNMKRDYRTVIYLFYYEDMSINEIASILDIKENAVKTRLSRARDALRKEVAIG